MDEPILVIEEEIATIVPDEVAILEVEGEPEVAVPAPLWRQPAYQAYQLLHAGFAVAPFMAGLDKFRNRMVNWDMYLHPAIGRRSPGGARGFMKLVGAIEMGAGILTAFRPRLGGYVVSGWLMGIIANLLTQRRYQDIALRDFGLSMGAFSLARLARQYRRP